MHLLWFGSTAVELRRVTSTSMIASVMQEMGITVMLAGNMGMGAFNWLRQPRGKSSIQDRADRVGKSCMNLRS